MQFDMVENNLPDSVTLSMAFQDAEIVDPHSILVFL